MSYLLIDDRLEGNPKIMRAWMSDAPHAVGLYVLAMAWCAQHETDGVLDPLWVEQKLRLAGDRKGAAVSALVAAGLLDVLPAGEAVEVTDRHGHTTCLGPHDEDRHIVHNFLARNDSRAYREDKRRRDRDRHRSNGSRGGRPTDSTQTPHDLPEDSARNPDGLRAEDERTPNPAGHVSKPPDPTHIQLPPLPPQGGRSRDFEAYRAQVRRYARYLLPAAPDADEAHHAVRAALGGLGRQATDEKVLAHIQRWSPQLTGDSSRAT